MHQKARRSLVAARPIPRGARIEPDVLTIKRPGFGIKPKYADLVVGRTARVDIEVDTLIIWELL